MSPEAVSRVVSLPSELSVRQDSRRRGNNAKGTEEESEN